jgi:dipeptidyl aminopeptidase/acylaminoacyl peptidase
MDTSSGAPQAYPSTPGMYNLTTQAEGHTVYYTLRIPAGYEGHTALPVILCLHFGGQPTEFYGGRFLNLIPGPGLGSLAALLVAPTTAQSGWATPTGEAAAFAALAAVEQHLRVDTRRRVVMGYSMGGRGTWHLAATFRSHFVAAIPIASRPGEIALDTLRDLPLYVIHSEADRRVPIEDTAKAVEQLHAMDAPVEFAHLPSGDHFDYRLVIAELRTRVCPWLETVWQHP